MDRRPIAAQFCVTFLKPEMLHIYRQVTGLRRYEPVVYAQKRENAADFPFDSVRLFPRSSGQWLRRWWFRQVCGRPLTIEPSRVRAIRDDLQEVGASLLHVYFGHIGVFLMPLIRELDIPVIVSFHGADAKVDLDQGHFLSATKWMLQNVAMVLVRSDAMGEQLQALGCMPSKIRRQRTGIPLAAFPFAERKVPADGSWHLVQACRLIPKKGLGHTIEAFGRFLGSFPSARLTIAGEGPLLSELRGQAASLGISNRVSFPGFLRQAELRSLYESCHLFLHPSETARDGNQEGVPNSMLEAMASGLPVIATRHGGIPEAIVDGVSGLLTREGDVDGLHAAMWRLAADPALYGALAQGGYRTVRAEFEIGAQIANLEGIYDDVVRGK